MRTRFFIEAWALVLLCWTPTRAHAATGPYSSGQATLNAAGGISTSGAYAHAAALGESFIGESAGAVYFANHGYPLELALRSSRELVSNGSFEDQAGRFVADSYGLMSLTPGATLIPGWKTTQAELAWVRNGNTFGAASPFGEFFLELTGYHDRAPYGGVEQSVPTTPGEEYVLSLSIGSNSTYPGAGGQKQVTVTAGPAGVIFTFDPPGTEVHDWRSFSFAFTATADATAIRISGLNSGGGVYLALDNISVVPASGASRLILDAVRISGGELRIRFPATSGRSYTLESRASIESGNWVDVPLPAIDNGDGTRDLILPDVLSSPQQFYRVKEQP